MVQGYGRNCAALLGLTGATVDTGHLGPDLLDLLELEPEDCCDGWDRPADSDLTGGRRRPGPATPPDR